MRRFPALLTWLAFPVYVWQGLGVRRRTSRMLPAQGPVMHEIAGGQPAVWLLVLGDSSAASVGIEKSENGLAAQLAVLISQRTGRAVRWRAAGFNSATSGQIRDHVLPNLSADPWTHIVLAIGTNDTKNFHSVPASRGRSAVCSTPCALNGLRPAWCGLLCWSSRKRQPCRRCSARSWKFAPVR